MLLPSLAPSLARAHYSPLKTIHSITLHARFHARRRAPNENEGGRAAHVLRRDAATVDLKHSAHATTRARHAAVEAPPAYIARSLAMLPTLILAQSQGVGGPRTGCAATQPPRIPRRAHMRRAHARHAAPYKSSQPRFHLARSLAHTHYSTNQTVTLPITDGSTDERRAPNESDGGRRAAHPLRRAAATASESHAERTCDTRTPCRAVEAGSAHVRQPRWASALGSSLARAHSHQSVATHQRRRDSSESEGGRGRAQSAPRRSDSGSHEAERTCEDAHTPRRGRWRRREPTSLAPSASLCFHPSRSLARAHSTDPFCPITRRRTPNERESDDEGRRRIAYSLRRDADAATAGGSHAARAHMRRAHATPRCYASFASTHLARSLAHTPPIRHYPSPTTESYLTEGKRGREGRAPTAPRRSHRRSQAARAHMRRAHAARHAAVEAPRTSTAPSSVRSPHPCSLAPSHQENPKKIQIRGGVAASAIKGHQSGRHALPACVKKRRVMQEPKQA